MHVQLCNERQSSVQCRHYYNEKELNSLLDFLSYDVRKILYFFIFYFKSIKC